MKSITHDKKHIERRTESQASTLLACPECGRISPGERFVRSHWTHQHVEALGEFPGAELVTVGGES